MLCRHVIKYTAHYLANTTAITVTLIIVIIIIITIIFAFEYNLFSLHKYDLMFLYD